MKKVDWTKEPEIRWEKKICPICREPTGESSMCYNMLDRSGDMIGGPEEIEAKTVEVNGELFPLFSQQCYYRTNNDYWVFFNYPVSIALVNVIAEIEGVESVIVRSPYKITVTIGEQFDDTQVRASINKKYREFINGIRKQKI
jgi:hypothetical protein